MKRRKEIAEKVADTHFLKFSFRVAKGKKETEVHRCVKNDFYLIE